MDDAPRPADTRQAGRFKDSPQYGYANQIDYTNKRHKPYGTRKKDVLFLIYLAAIIIWGIIIAYLSPQVGLWGWIIICIPIFVFVIAILTLDSLSPAVEDGLFQTNVLSTGILIILPLLAFITKDFRGDHVLMIEIVLLAITFTLISMIDVWIPEKWLTVTQHVRSIFQTASLTLILFALYLYYSTMEHLPWIPPGPGSKRELASIFVPTAALGAAATAHHTIVPIGLSPRS